MNRSPVQDDPVPDETVRDETFMREALRLAARAEGYVEPNPMVGCVITHGDLIVGRGWHQVYGRAHAEVNALADAGEQARGGTAYVTLEPCCHFGKTPPCSAALIAAQIARVVVAQPDPFPRVAGGGLAELRQAGVRVDVGVLQTDAERLNAPYLKRLRTARPWVIAKWAMTLDGKLATAAGSSQWISSPASRAIVHRLRGRVDAVLVGRETAQRDNPALTARGDLPPARQAARVIADSAATLSIDSQLVVTANAGPPVLVAVAQSADPQRCDTLAQRGCQIIRCAGDEAAARLDDLLRQLSNRGMTNVLVEGGGQLLGSLFDLGQLDEVHAFIAPKLIGGAQARSPRAGRGREPMQLAQVLQDVVVEQIGDGDVYVRGRVR